LDEEALQNLKKAVENGPTTIKINNDEFEVSKEVISFTTVTKRLTGEAITPGVIEPSFGIGRILYSILEHAYSTRGNDEQRAVLSLTPSMAPVKVSVLPLYTNQPELTKKIPEIEKLLTENGISFKVDKSSTTIGKRYARTDEIGVPFGITIDDKTVENSTDEKPNPYFNTVTLRDRDSTAQVRVPIKEVALVIQSLVNGNEWKDVQSKYPNVKEEVFEKK